MREILFRGKRTDGGEWVYGYLYQDGLIGCNIFQTNPHLAAYIVDPSTIGQYTGLTDKNGVKIFEGDILRFHDKDGTWETAVEFTRGLFGLDVCHPKQIKNPDEWDMPYDRVKSRWWGCHWGYEEYGTAFTYREPLAKATLYTEGKSGDNEAWNNSEYKKWHDKYGWREYRVDSEVIGNIYDNPALAGKEGTE